MKKYFYHKIIDFQSVLEEIGTLDMTDVQKKELEELAHDHLHQVILDAILDELPLREKKIFLANIEYEGDEKIWQHLNSNVENIEDKIVAAANSLKEQLHKDIREVKS